MKKLFRATITAPVTAAVLAFSPLLAYAQPRQPPGGVTAPSDVYTDPNDWVDLLIAITNWIFYILTFVAVIMLLYAAFLYITAGDDEEKVKKAKNIIIYAVIGLMIALLANGVPTLLRTIIGVY